MASIDRKRENKVPIDEKPKKLLFFVTKKMEKLKDIWNIWSLNETIYTQTFMLSFWSRETSRTF